MNALVRCAALVAALFCLPLLPLHAQTPTPAGADVALRVGTLGIGPEVSKQINGHLAARLGFNNYTYSRNATLQGITYDGRLRLSNITALADLFPSTGSGFHVTAGLVFNSNKLSGTGQPGSGQTYTFNGVTYPAAAVGTLNGEATFPKTAPYLGIGIGRAAGRGGALQVLFDVGAVFQGKPRLSLTATGALANPLLAASLAAQRDKTQSDVNKFNVYPALSVGAAYRF